MESIDFKHLDNLWVWNKKHFANHKVIIEEMYTALAQADEEEGDFNVLGKITQIVPRDGFMSDIWITDASNSTWFATISRKKFPRIKEGELVKIRSVEIDDSTERDHTLRFAPHSNIMTIVSFSKLHSQLKITNLQDKVDKELLKAKILHEPVLASTVSKKYQNSQVHSLSDLFGNPKLEGDTFRARFFVVNATSGEDSIVSSKGKRSKTKGEDYFS